MRVVAGIVYTVRRMYPDDLVFLVDLAQAAKVPARTPLEVLAPQNGEQILHQLGYW